MLILNLIRWLVHCTVFAFTAGFLAICLMFSTPEKSRWMLQLCLKISLKIFGLKPVFMGENRHDSIKGSVVLFNHNSFLDHFLIVSYLNAYVFGVEKSSNYKIPLYGYVSKKWGNIGIDRSDRSQSIAALETLKEKLKSGFSVILAPEGTRKPVGELKPFKKGAFYFATQTGAPIVPITLKGMETFNPDGTFLIRPGKVIMHIGKPIQSQGKDLEALKAELEAYYRKTLRELPEPNEK